MPELTQAIAPDVVDDVKTSTKVIHFVPSERPRDVMMRYVLKELGRTCAWQAEFDAALRPFPRSMTEDEIALDYILNLLRLVEASPTIQSELAAMMRGRKKTK